MKFDETQGSVRQGVRINLAQPDLGVSDSLKLALLQSECDSARVHKRGPDPSHGTNPDNREARAGQHCALLPQGT